MEWSHKAPLEAGWYWVIHPKRYKPAMKKVSISWQWGSSGLLVCGSVKVEDMAKDGYVWFGPLSPPKPPDDKQGSPQQL